MTSETMGVLFQHAICTSERMYKGSDFTMSYIPQKVVGDFNLMVLVVIWTCFSLDKHYY